jgi:hypothetical protein
MAVWQDGIHQARPSVDRPTIMRWISIVPDATVASARAVVPTAPAPPRLRFAQARRAERGRGPGDELVALGHRDAGHAAAVSAARLRLEVHGTRRRATGPGCGASRRP